MRKTQVVIIGAGPIGLELAASFKAMDVAYEHIEAGQVGQTMTWYPRQTRFFSSPDRIALANLPLHTVDQSKATREEYLAYLRAFVRQFDLQIHTYERVHQIEHQHDGFIVHSSLGVRGEETHCRQVVLAIGDMHHPRMLRVPGEDMAHVSHYFEEPHAFFGKKLLIIGGRNSAVEAALRCHHAGARVAISYRRHDFDPQVIKYWLLPEIQSLIKHQQIQFHPCTIPKQIDDQVVTLEPSRHREGCEACPPRSHHPVQVEADFVLILTGYVQDTTLLKQAGVELVNENQSPLIDEQTMQTNVPGLYVAGTAAAGTQINFRLFIENCHSHVSKIVKHITGQDPPAGLVNPIAKTFELPES